VAALLIGVSKAGFGGGTGILVGPILALVFQGKEAIALMLPLLFACDLASVYFYWRQWDWQNVIGLLPGAAVGILLGSLVLDALSDQMLAQCIGIMAISFAVLQLGRSWFARSAKPLQPRFWLSTLIGLGTGFVSTLSHVGGILTSMYLLAQGLDNQRFVGTTTAVYFLINLGKFPVFFAQGLLGEAIWLRDLPMFPVVFAGTALGAYLNRRVSAEWFSRVVLAFVLVTGIMLLIQNS
jgi:uncharacterized membrane protein YfcA